MIKQNLKQLFHVFLAGIIVGILGILLFLWLPLHFMQAATQEGMEHLRTFPSYAAIQTEKEPTFFMVVLPKNGHKLVRYTQINGLFLFPRYTLYFDVASDFTIRKLPNGKEFDQDFDALQDSNSN